MNSLLMLSVVVIGLGVALAVTPRPKPEEIANPPPTFVPTDIPPVEAPTVKPVVIRGEPQDDAARLRQIERDAARVAAEQKALVERVKALTSEVQKQ